MRSRERWVSLLASVVGRAAAPLLLVASFAAPSAAQSRGGGAGASSAGAPSPASPAPKGSHDDVVESIPPESATPETPPGAPPVPVEARPEGPANRSDVAGWARESTEWTFTPTGSSGAAPSPFDVPHDRLVSRTQLFVRASHARGGWFEATVSGILGYSVREQGASNGVPFNGLNGRMTNADSQIELHELYVGLFSKHIDFRLGQQRVAWGRADLRSPNDVLNAFDFRDPILTETELRHVPTPLLRADIDLGAVSVQLVGTPVFVPDAYDVYGTNWGALQADAPPALKGLFGSVSPLVDPTKRGQLNALLHDTQLPASNWAAPSAGAKVSGALAGIDLDLYYHYGFDTTPYVTLDSSFERLLGALNFSAFRPSDLTPVLQRLDAGVSPFTAVYVRRHHVGFDAAGTAGPFVWRLDGAYESQRVRYHADLTSFSSPAVLGVASVEYQTGDIDKVILLEAIYDGIVDPLGAPLLGYRQHSFALAGTLRWPLAPAWAIDARELVGITPASFALKPALHWKPDDAVVFAAGAVLLGGESASFGWYFRHNTSAFVQAKYAF